MVKLTANQRKALFEMMMTSRVTEKFMPMTILQLADLGLVEKTFSVVGYHRTYWRITDAGRAALERSEV